MKIQFNSVSMSDAFFNPTIVITVNVQFEEGNEALINASGDLIYNGKSIGRLQLWKESLYNIYFPSFTISAQNREGKTKGDEKDLQLEFQVELRKKVVKYINEGRKSYKNGDVHFFINVKLLYVKSTTYIVDPKKDLRVTNNPEMKLLSTLGGNSMLEFKNISQTIEASIKASDWINDFAPKLGLGEYEIIEIKNFSKDDLPRAKDFNEVLEKINQANNKLLERKSPEDILTDLRSAWDIFDMYHRENIDEINKLIGGKSKKEEKEPSKEDRIEDIHSAIKEYLRSINELKKKIDKFTQIGAHREIYYSTMEDAELGFRLTTSLIAYYSNILSKITGDGENE